MAENLILTGPDGTEYTFPGVSKVSIRKSGGGRAEYGSGGVGGIYEQVFNRTVGNVTASDLDGLTAIEQYAFAGCRGMRSIEIPSTVSDIMCYAFAACGLYSITIPSTVSYVGLDSTFLEQGRVFRNCESLETVVFGNTVVIFGDYCFEGCTALRAVVLPATNGRYYGLFKGCTRLSSIRITATTPPDRVDSDTFNGVPTSCAIYVPAASVNAYKSASIWSARASHIYPLT